MNDIKSSRTRCPIKGFDEQVKRNIERFPDDFMFQLTKEEFEEWKSQFATSSWGGVRRLPYAFTEQGIAMLSSVLKSKTADDEVYHIGASIKDLDKKWFGFTLMRDITATELIKKKSRLTRLWRTMNAKQTTCAILYKNKKL